MIIIMMIDNIYANVYGAFFTKTAASSGLYGPYCITITIIIITINAVSLNFSPTFSYLIIIILKFIYSKSISRIQWIRSMINDKYNYHIKLPAV